jgi:hypothetical protein
MLLIFIYLNKITIFLFNIKNFKIYLNYYIKKMNQKYF